ncbi:PREDICTED: LOW QUALITY PROTEIN: pyridoxine/pyridoxamine 5'-phosphate oxidase-like, partial [Cyphomyrmex costatus]|uniref:LOW QUALITY PROTEIN: pyridoxine/pyridoxamine 5'-phosphate oxidase-like n=1 Tax=Cyphomyrmex costatus TaxID=456900 RepID=UPI0008522AA4
MVIARWLPTAIKLGLIPLTCSAAGWTAELVEPNAMALATATRQGRPSVRTVLLKAIDDDGLVFYTNYESRKGSDLAANPYAAATMLWHPMHRQVRVEGAVTRVSGSDSDDYFASRPRGSRLSAVASPQSQTISDPADLQERWADLERHYGDGTIPRPLSWGGYRIAVEQIEFWQGRRNR